MLKVPISVVHARTARILCEQNVHQISRDGDDINNDIMLKKK